MTQQHNPANRANRALRHQVVTGLQILTLTAELLAMDLRNGARSAEQIEERSQALHKAIDRVTRAANRLPVAGTIPYESAGGTLADSDAMRVIRGFGQVIVRYIDQPDVERDVLAEYVEELHRRANELITSIDRTTEA